MKKWPGVILSALVAGGIYWGWRDTPSPVMEKITIGTMPLSANSHTVFVAMEKGFFLEHGLAVTLKSYKSGAEVLQAVTNKEVDFGGSSETPFMNAILQGAPLAVLATTITAQQHMGVVARKDLGVQKPSDLAGKKIGVTRGSNGEYFLDLVLQMARVPLDSVVQVNLFPAEMEAALLRGQVDAVAAWNPTKLAVAQKLGEQGVVFDGRGLYNPMFLLVTHTATIAASPQLISKVLASLMDASRFTRNHLAEAHDLVAQHTGMDSQLLKDSSAHYIFQLTLDQGLVMSLENQAQWALHRTPDNKRNIPDFLPHLHTPALSALSPTSVTIVR